MWQAYASKVSNQQPRLRRARWVTDSNFQFKYSLIVAAAAGLGTILTVIPIYYLLHQNYQIFTDLAYENAPNLLQPLERERVWVNTLLLGNFSGVVVFFTVLSLRMTRRIVGPIKVLKNHLKWLSRGRWDQPVITLRESDEFHELIATYNYFYRSYRTQLKKELELLRLIQVPEKDRSAFLAWKQLVEERLMMLTGGRETADPRPIFLRAEGRDSLHDQPHAS